jgi:hypothetical protein
MKSGAGLSSERIYPHLLESLYLVERTPIGPPLAEWSFALVR